VSSHSKPGSDPSSLLNPDGVKGTPASQPARPPAPAPERSPTANPSVVAAADSRLERAWGKVLNAFGLAAGALLLALMLVICADVLLRNVPLWPQMRGIGAANDLSEAALYLITLLSAPWLLRRGMHIRVDILLRAVPASLAWAMEWAVDLLGLVCCLIIAGFAGRATLEAYESGELFIKALATPVWWWLSVLPVVFVLLAVEFVFRMRRLATGPRGARQEATSAA